MKESITRLFGVSEKEYKQIKEIPVDQISPSPYQPRIVFDDQRLNELCQTIRVHGVIQPIVVRKKQQGYELIAGERRLRAVKKLNIPTIPAILKDMSDSQAASVSLIENLQREELSAIEEACAYQKLIELHQLTQESLAQRLGKGQSTIANKLRLLQLPEQVQTALRYQKITERHARALLRLPQVTQKLAMLEETISKKWTVKQLEEQIEKKLHKNRNRKVPTTRKPISRDKRIAINTIRQSIQMVQESGIEIETEEKETTHYVEVVIRIKNK